MEREVDHSMEAGRGGGGGGRGGVCCCCRGLGLRIQGFTDLR